MDAGIPSCRNVDTASDSDAATVRHLTVQQHQIGLREYTINKHAYLRAKLFRFPFVEAEKQKWLDVIGKSNVSLGKRTSVCSIHFERSCFRYGLVNGRELLRQGSVPTLQLTRPPGDYF
ncbi:jg20416 [Pararge aegeria aegeria]|uniref:Jg20416 protein n=1 Tax=Pararge aegeria aegeria TaxID=348720 RepID=A0A8S4RI36_9NEOP|nr:jg20416 [Pararge aegeria aegeria]